MCRNNMGVILKPHHLMLYGPKMHHTIGKYEGWNFNFGNTPLDWIQELLE